MKTIAFSARVDELNELADHVPVSVLASRLLAVVEAYLEANKAPAGTETMAAAFRTLDASPGPGERMDELVSYVKSLPPSVAGDDHFYVAPGVETRALLPEVMGEITAHNEDGYDPEDVPPASLEEEPVTTKPGPPVGGKEEPKPPTGESDSTRSQDGEPEKTCKDCGEKKPLSEFPKHSEMRDGHLNTCRKCRSAYESERKKKRKGAVAELPQREAHLCAAGSRCVRADPDDLVPTPAILDAPMTTRAACVGTARRKPVSHERPHVPLRPSRSFLWPRPVRRGVRDLRGAGVGRW